MKSGATKEQIQDFKSRWMDTSIYGKMSSGQAAFNSLKGWRKAEGADLNAADNQVQREVEASAEMAKILLEHALLTAEERSKENHQDILNEKMEKLIINGIPFSNALGYSAAENRLLSYLDVAGRMVESIQDINSPKLTSAKDAARGYILYQAENEAEPILWEDSVYEYLQGADSKETVVSEAARYNLQMSLRGNWDPGVIMASADQKGLSEGMSHADELYDALIEACDSDVYGYSNRAEASAAFGNADVVRTFHRPNSRTNVTVMYLLTHGLTMNDILSDKPDMLEKKREVGDHLKSLFYESTSKTKEEREEEIAKIYVAMEKETPGLLNFSADLHNDEKLAEELLNIKLQNTLMDIRQSRNANIKSSMIVLEGGQEEGDKLIRQQYTTSELVLAAQARSEFVRNNPAFGNADAVMSQEEIFTQVMARATLEHMVKTHRGQETLKESESVYTLPNKCEDFTNYFNAQISEEEKPFMLSELARYAAMPNQQDQVIDFITIPDPDNPGKDKRQPVFTQEILDKVHQQAAMAAENKKISDIYEALTQGQGRFHVDSKEYKAIINTLKQINESAGEKADGKNLRDIQALYGTLGQQCDIYLAGKTKDSRHTETGKRRFDLIQELRQQQAADVEAIGNIDVGEIKKVETWGELIGKSRTKKIHVNTQETTKVGAAMSSRMHIQVDGLDGFFTESTKYESIEETAAGLANDVPERFKDYFMSLSENVGLSPLYNQMIKRATPEMLEKQYNEWQKWAHDRAASKLGEAEVELLENDPDYAEHANKVFLQLSAKKPANAMLNSAGISVGRNLDERNVAMSRIASLLGKPNLIAHSRKMELVDESGNTMQGIFMEKAEGFDIAKRSEDPMFSRHVDFDTVGLKKDLADLQILDYICGNIDRHSANMFYDIREDETTQKRYVAGIMGIDNDTSFGILTSESALKYGETQMSGSNALGAINADMAAKVLSFNRPILEYALQDVLTKEEIDAAWIRTQSIQNAITMQITAPREMEANTQINIMYSDREWELNSLADLKTRAGKNYFSIAESVSAGIDYNNRIKAEKAAATTEAKTEKKKDKPDRVRSMSFTEFAGSDKTAMEGRRRSQPARTLSNIKKAETMDK